MLLQEREPGFLAEVPQRDTGRIARLLAHLEMRADIGRKAKDLVHDHFILPRLLYDYMVAVRRARTFA